jgi:PAS domain S-box-containing protein
LDFTHSGSVTVTRVLRITDRFDPVVDNEAASLAVDLTLCEQEPIHIPGAIQPHGALLATLADGSLITHASANVAAVLGRPAEELFGRPLAMALGDAACQVLLGATPGARTYLTQVHAIPGPGGGSLHLQSHRSGQRICVDIEPVRSEVWQQPSVTMAQSVIETFAGAPSRSELCERAVAGLKAITGYDRVMAYRFDRDGNGEVISESCEPGLTPYLGQHYPAADIPPQARQQYLNQRVGIIGDSDYEPVPLVIDTKIDDGTPLDLTHSALRSASPVHRQYMRNMGTAASLTIGLALEGDLWGMLVCHHTTPRVAGPEMRAVAAMIGQVVSLLLGSLGAAEVYARQLERNVTLRSLVDRLAAPAPMIHSLAAMETELMHLVDAGGAIVCFGGTIVCLGRTPERLAAERALAVMRSASGGEPLAVDDLGLRYPALADCTLDGSGALMLPVGDDAEDAILWFRPELARTVTWGGDPAAHSTADPVTGVLSPRVSFNAWKEIVRGRSLPWTDADLALALGLRRAFEAEVARRMKASRDLFNRVFESSPSALVLIGRDGLIKMLNRQTEQIFGLDRADLEEQPVERLVPERFRKFFVEQQVRALTTKSAHLIGQEDDISGLRADGTEFPLEASLSAVYPVDFVGEPMVQASLVDLTLRIRLEREKIDSELARQRRERELEQSNADLAEFAYAVAHDLKGPVRAIAHLAEWVHDDIAGSAPPETLDNIKLLEARIVRMKKLLDDLLEYSCLRDTGRATDDVSVEALVGEIVAMLGLSSAFTVSFEGKPVIIHTELVALQMVLENLISNAVKHHDRDTGRVTVSARKAEGLAEILVSDDGPGIARQFHERIFTIFETLKRHDTTEGSGIGLAIAKRKVECPFGNFASH